MNDPDARLDRVHEGVAMFDLDSMTDEELGRMIRVTLRSKGAHALAKQKEDVADLAEFRAERREERRSADQDQREHYKQLGFIANGFVVPAIDARNEALDTLAPDAVRQTYNRARVSLGIKELLDPETTTWRACLIEHVSLSVKAKERKQTPQIAALIDERSPAKIATLSETCGISQEAAEELIKYMA